MRLKPEEETAFRVFGGFSVDPLVVLVPTHSFLVGNGTILDWLEEVAPRRRTLVLLQPLWSLEFLEVNRLYECLGGGLVWDVFINRLKSYTGPISVIVVANTQKDMEICHSVGLRSVFISQNLFVDEEVFCIKRAAEIEFDAVLNARMGPLKRHYLAKKIAKLALIYGDSCVSDKVTLDCYYRVRAVLPHATYLNGAFSRNKNTASWRWLSAKEVAAVYNKSRVGLSLSAVEGANWASMEYLLCGLPVVATQGLGGREVFFTPQTAVICADDSGAVAQAVAQVGAEQRDPEQIRRITLDLVAEHRQRFAELLTDFAPQLGWDQMMTVIRNSERSCQILSLAQLRAWLS